MRLSLIRLNQSNPMKNLTIFAADKIRLHANETTVDGLGIAIDPFFVLPLEASDEELEYALRQCLEASRTEAPHRPWQEAETSAYYRKLGVRSQRELGRGLDLTRKADRYILTPIEAGGRFGEPLSVMAEELLEAVRECLGLPASRPAED